MKPKPLSIRHRLIYLQAVAFALTIWLLAGAVYANLRIRQELEQSLKTIRASFELDAKIDALQPEEMVAAAKVLFRAGPTSKDDFQAAAAKMSDLLTQSFQQAFPPEEHRTLVAMEGLHQRLVQRVKQHSPHPESTPEGLHAYREVRQLNDQINALQSDLSRTELARLELVTGRLREYTRALYLLLLASALFACLMFRQLGRVHQREIWDPLEELQGMVAQVRRGNLDVSAPVPHSLEFGPLVKGFLEMANELREMRDSLEERVRQRSVELEKTQAQLLQAAKLSSLGELVSGVAHEINNPLTSILGFCELELSQPNLDAGLRRHLLTIREEALRLKTLVANLNSFARRSQPRVECLDLRRILDRLVEWRRYQLAACNIALHYDPPPRPVWVEGDKDQLAQAFFNLVLNSEQAIAARGRKGDIWLDCSADQQSARATVRDNSGGIPAAVLEPIFDPFFTTKPVGQGTGLGLSISRWIIEQHRGSISVESIEGHATTMHITLPLANPSDAAQSSPPQPIATPRVSATNLRALIIDDEPSISSLVEQYLNSRRWKSVVLNDPMALESALAGQQFDAVICDLKMPGRNGLEVLELLRKMWPELARCYLLITGNLADAGEKEAVALAGVPVLRKPFSLSQLAEALNQLLTNKD